MSRTLFLQNIDDMNPPSVTNSFHRAFSSSFEVDNEQIHLFKTFHILGAIGTAGCARGKVACHSATLYMSALRLNWTWNMVLTAPSDSSPNGFKSQISRRAYFARHKAVCVAVLESSDDMGC